MGSALRYFALLLALSAPLWVVGGVFPEELLPGLPVGALMFVCPALAALLLRWRDRGREGIGALFRTLAPKGPWWGVAFALAIHPVIFAASFLLDRALGSPIPAPELPLASIATLAGAFFFAAVTEELGWSGYLLEPLKRRVGVLPAALVIGALWASWHVVVLVQAERSALWIAWWSLWTVGSRVILVWLYERMQRSVLPVALCHAASNVCWQLYPIHGSYFDPQLTALVTLPVAAALALALRRSRRGPRGLAPKG